MRSVSFSPRSATHRQPICPSDPDHSPSGVVQSEATTCSRIQSDLMMSLTSQAETSAEPCAAPSSFLAASSTRSSLDTPRELVHAQPAQETGRDFAVINSQLVDHHQPALTLFELPTAVEAPSKDHHATSTTAPASSPSHRSPAHTADVAPIGLGIPLALTSDRLNETSYTDQLDSPPPSGPPASSARLGDANPSTAGSPAVSSPSMPSTPSSPEVAHGLQPTDRAQAAIAYGSDELRPARPNKTPATTSSAETALPRIHATMISAKLESDGRTVAPVETPSCERPPFGLRVAPPAQQRDQVGTEDGPAVDLEEGGVQHIPVVSQAALILS